jgi:hypothetical protein
VKIGFEEIKFLKPTLYKNQVGQYEILVAKPEVFERLIAFAEDVRVYTPHVVEFPENTEFPKPELKPCCKYRAVLTLIKC